VGFPAECRNESKSLKKIKKVLDKWGYPEYNINVAERYGS
jgi:hypothetical protein